MLSLAFMQITEDVLRMCTDAAKGSKRETVTTMISWAQGWDGRTRRVATSSCAARNFETAEYILW